MIDHIQYIEGVYIFVFISFCNLLVLLQVLEKSMVVKMRSVLNFSGF